MCSSTLYCEISPLDRPSEPRPPWQVTWLAALWLSLLFTPRAFALDPNKSVYQFNCQNWTRQDGLPVDKINTVTQTNDGYVWLGTQNGLIRFDGAEFKMIPVELPYVHDQEVRKLFKAESGGMWCAINNGGFCRYHNGQFTPIDDARWGLGLNAMAVSETRRGTVWTGSVLGLGRWVPHHPELSAFDEQTTGMVLSFCEDSQGRVWVGTVERGLFCWRDGKFTQVPDEFLKKHLIFALAADAQGNIWVGTEVGLRCYDSQGQPRTIPTLETEVKALLIDRHGRLWIGTTSAGLVCCQNGELTYLRKTDGLGSDFILSLFEDVEGSLWIGTRDGLSQLTDVKFPIYSNREGITEGASHAVTASRKGGLWITTASGLSYFDGHAATNHTTDLTLDNRYLKRAFEARNGDVYLVDGNKSIGVFSGNQIAATYPNQTWPTSLAEDARGILVAIEGALYRMQDGKVQPYEFEGGVPPTFFWINNLHVAQDGAIWVASNNGIFRIRDRKFRQWSTEDGLPSNGVYSICEGVDGTIWAGLETGVARIKAGQLKTIRPRDGLHDGRIYAIVPDDFDSLWMASGRGILRVNSQSLNDFADGKSPRIRCDLFDGLESVKFTDRTEQEFSGCKTLDGRIWFPNPRGVVMVDPAQFASNEIAPVVHIEQVRANGQDLNTNLSTTVEPGDGELEFRFTALSFIAPHKIQFRYQLEGYDKDWVAAGDRRMAFYTNLKPGEYQFRVIAANADGVWNNTGDSLRIELLPHFHQTAWFTLLCGGLFCLFLTGVYAWRVRHLKCRQQALQISRDLLEAEVRKRTAELALANLSLTREIDDRKRTEAELAQRTKSLESEIEERNRVQLENQQVHQKLLETSRQAGMAEVATNVLHNVGNVLNSVNVSASLVAESVKKSKATSLSQVVDLLKEHENDLGTFITHDMRGKQLPRYLASLSGHILADQAETVRELNSLRGNIDHIKEIVAMQQSYARVSGVIEIVSPIDLVEDALRMNADSLMRHGVEVIREFEAVPPVNVEKHKVLQILVNLIRNAKYACDDSGRDDRRMTLKVWGDHDRISISVIDNGVGIPPENLTRIFNHGFTTRKSGHGFGLHSGALAAGEMGGSLSVYSDGVGLGATFTLKLPLTQDKSTRY